MVHFFSALSCFFSALSYFISALRCFLSALNVFFSALNVFFLPLAVLARGARRLRRLLRGRVTEILLNVHRFSTRGRCALG